MNGPALSAHTCQADVRVSLRHRKRIFRAACTCGCNQQRHREERSVFDTRKMFQIFPRSDKFNFFPQEPSSRGKIVLRAQHAFTRKAFERFRLRSLSYYTLISHNFTILIISVVAHLFAFELAARDASPNTQQCLHSAAFRRAAFSGCADASPVAFDVPVIKLRQINQCCRGCVNVKCPALLRNGKAASIGGFWSFLRGRGTLEKATSSGHVRTWLVINDTMQCVNLFRSALRWLSMKNYFTLTN